TWAGPRCSVTVCNLSKMRMVRNSICRGRPSQPGEAGGNPRFVARFWPVYAGVNNPQREEMPDARDADLRPLYRDPLRADDAGAAGRLSLVDRDARPAAGPEQDLGRQPKAGEGHGPGRRVFSHWLLLERARTRNRGRRDQQQVAFDLPDQRARTRRQGGWAARRPSRGIALRPAGLVR